MNAIKVKKKLLNKKGETLVEVLVSTLLVALSMLGLSTMINVSRNIMETSDKAIKNMYENMNAIEQQKDNIKKSEKVSISISSDFGTVSIPVTVYVADDTVYVADDMASYELE